MPIPDPIKVLVVDDHIGIRHGISSLVDSEHPRMCSVGSAATCAQALEMAHERQPDVVVLDVDLDGEDGLQMIAALRKVARCEVVILTSLVDPCVAAQALRFGASACVHKTAPAVDLLACILAARPLADPAATAIPPNAGVGLSCLTGSNHP